MPISRSAEPVGSVRRWVERCLCFLEDDISNYTLYLHQRGYSVADIMSFKKAMRAFFDGGQLTDHAFCLCLDLSGALVTWFSDNEQYADERHNELVSFMFDCLMDGQVSMGAIANARSGFARISAH